MASTLEHIANDEKYALPITKYDGLLKRISSGPIYSVQELIDYMIDNPHRIRTPQMAAKETGIPYHLYMAVVSSREFHRAYFDRIHKSVFTGAVLEEGMKLLAEDFINPDVAVRDRLAIFRMLQDMFGATPAQKVEHEVKGTTYQIRLEIAAKPEDFATIDASVVEEAKGALGSGNAEEPRSIPVRPLQADEEDTGSVLEVPVQEVRS